MSTATYFYLLSQFEKLAELRAAALDPASNTPYVAYSASLRSLTAECYEFDDKTIQKILYSCWLDHLVHGFESDWQNEAFGNEADFFIKGIDKYELVDDFMSDDKKVLAFVSVLLARVLLATTGRHTYRKTPIKKVFDHCAIRPVDTAALNSPAGAMDYLIGPGVWDLYFHQESNTRSIPSKLLSLKLQTVYSQQKCKNQTKLNVSLPLDFDSF